MENSQIEILDVNKTENGYLAEYCLNGEDKELLIETGLLTTYIIDNELNRQEFINHSAISMDCDGLDQSFTDPYTVLEEDYFEIVTGYLKALHKIK